MNVLGIVGSPRRERGRSHQVVARVLEGAQAAGAQTELLYLVDEQPAYCIHCGYNCFTEGDCAQEPEATVRSQVVEGADALVLCAPVYCWQPNGLTVALFDKMRLGTGPWNRASRNGRSALGIALAGGTGTGVFPALQSICAWLCLWKFRPLDPLPVTRFNLPRILEDAAGYGKTLAESTPEPFDGVADLMLTYDSLPYMRFGRIDEFRWLAEQTAAALQSNDARRAQMETVNRLLAEARACRAAGDRAGEAQRIIEAYQEGARAA